MADQQAPPSLGFSRQEHWSGLPFPSPRLWLKGYFDISPFLSHFSSGWSLGSGEDSSGFLGKAGQSSGQPLSASESTRPSGSFPTPLRGRHRGQTAAYACPVPGASSLVADLSPPPSKSLCFRLSLVSGVWPTTVFHSV